MLNVSGSASGTLHGAECAPRVLMAGSFVNFSDRILSLLQKEFPEYEFQRVDETALDGAIPTDGLHLLICEEGLAAKVLEPSVLGRASVAVAFDDVRSIASRLLGLGVERLPAGLSLLPMNVRIDAWLTIMGLLLYRETYVPVEVLRWLGGMQDDRAPASRPGAGTEAVPRPREVPVRPDPILQKLTARERKVLPLIAQGKQNKVIADELEMSEHTVKLHVHHIIGKLGVRNRTEAAGYYLSQSSVQGNG